MESMYLLHISDLHFAGSGEGLSPDRALEKLGRLLVEKFPNQKFTLAITGDITSQGKKSGFQEALRSLKDKLLKVIDCNDIILIPGNHDIDEKKSTFIEFNKFSFNLINDYTQIWNSSQSVNVVPASGYEFISVNSSYKGDYKRGHIPMDDLKSALEASDSPNKIILVHHSPISSEYGKGGIDNAFDFLSLAAKHKVLAILHGDVHSDQSMLFSKNQTLVTGVGSLGFSPDGNMNNQFSILRFDNGSPLSGSLFKYYKNLDEFKLLELDII